MNENMTNDPQACKINYKRDYSACHSRFAGVYGRERDRACLLCRPGKGYIVVLKFMKNYIYQ
jgi:hypothetical protein